MKFYENTSLENLVTEYEGRVYVEEWRRIVGVSGLNKYEVSSFGCVRSAGRRMSTGGWRPAKIRKLSAHGKYIRLTLGSKTTSVHRLVCAAFHENPLRKPQVNHKDTDKYNNFFLNLEWCTQSENNQHAVENDRCWQGDLSRISYKDRQFIRDNFLTADREELAAMFGITVDQVYNIGTNRDTKFLPTLNVKDIGARKKYIPKEPAGKPIVDLDTGIVYPSASVLSGILGLSVRTVWRMLSGARYNRTAFRYVGQEDVVKLPPARIKKVKAAKPAPASKPPKLPKIKQPRRMPESARAVIKCDLFGNEVERFASVRVAVRALGVDRSYFKQVINGKAKGRTGYYKGFIYRWS